MYLDKGEDMAYVEGQIKRMATMKPAAYYFEIICRPNQLEEAAQNLAKFYELVLANMPGLPLNQLYTGITANEEIRPMMMTLALMTGGNVAFKDLNPERKAR